MVAVVYGDAKFLSNLFELIARVNDEGIIEVRNGRLEVALLDPSHVVAVRYRSKDGVECEGSDSVGVSFEELVKVLRRGRETAKISINRKKEELARCVHTRECAKKYPNKLHERCKDCPRKRMWRWGREVVVEFGNRRFTLKPIEVPDDDMKFAKSLKVKAMKLSASVEVDTREFREWLRDAELFSDTVTLNGGYMEAIGEMGSYRVALKENARKGAKANYSIRFLRDVVEPKLAEKVKLSWGTEKPLRILYPCGLEVFIAPRIGI